MAFVPRPPEELLRAVPALHGLPPADLGRLAEAAEVRTVPREELLFEEGQQAAGLHVVRTGELKITKRGRDEREQILYLARPGKPVVEGLRFDGGVYPASAIAMRNTTAMCIANDRIRDIGEARPGVMRALLDLRAQRDDRNLALIGDLALRTVPERLASFLCALVAARESKGQDARTLVRDLTTETVAGRLGTVREEISRALAYLEKQGALQVSPDVIEILDFEHLESVAYGPKK